jgi:dolichol-phosphate mannosyltransferase
LEQQAPTTRTLVIIPTFNEAENVRSVLEIAIGLSEQPDILVIDDGSPDGTADIVRTSSDAHPGRIHLHERPGKQGLGTAYIEGFLFALSRGYDLVCEMDADLSHNPEDLSRLIRPVAEGETDIAIGSRYVDGVRVINWPLSRLFLSYGAGIYTRLITRLPLRDVTSGFKCIHRRVLESIRLERIRSNGYSFQIEVNYRAWKKGFRLLEVPIIFTERSEGKSKMSRAIVHEAMFKVWEIRIRSILRRL